MAQTQTADFEGSAIYDEVFADIPFSLAMEISRQQRAEHEYSDPSLSYGEVDYWTMKRMFDKMHECGLEKDFGGKFIDVGCGTGRPVIAACLLHDFDSCSGIEILADLHALSKKTYERWNRTKVVRDVPTVKRETAISFINGDATAIDWSDADIAFVHATCFDDELMGKVVVIAERMKPGSFLISVSKKVTSAVFELLEDGDANASWGGGSCLLYRRLDMPIPLREDEHQFLIRLGVREAT